MDEPGDQPRAGYRPDIQGLRALAILVVVLCHAGIALPGGFIGVDVFFVVSGYVIGAKLLRELDGTGSVGLGAFYAGRARRLLPALAVVLVASIALTVGLFDPATNQIVPLKTSLAASFFVANGYLYRHLGYFDGTADSTNPFLHLWSLSVEEQFYLVFPVVVLGAWRLVGGDPARRRRRAAWLVGLLGAGSFVLGVALTSGWPSGIDAPARAAFYLSPPRFWELAAGVVLALVAGRRERLGAGGATVVAVLGAVLVVGGAVAIEPIDPFPGLLALVPVLGALLLLGGGDRSPAASAALSWAPLRWIGDRSYGWYLWHWPAIVFAGVLWPGSTVAAGLAALAGLGVAAVVHAAFEDRLRRDRRLVGRRALALATVCTLVPAALAIGAIAGAERGWGVDEPLDWYDFPAGRGVGCVLVNREMAATWPEEACTTEPSGGVARGTVMVLGDFHADGVATAVAEAAGRRGLRVKEWARAGCPFGGPVPAGYPKCAAWQEAALAEVARQRPEVVVLANRSTQYGEDPEAWQASLARTLRSLQRLGVQPVVVGGPPSYAGRFPEPSVLRPATPVPSRSRAEVDAEHAPIVAAERRATRAAGVPYVDPVPLLCGPRRCRPFGDGHWWYYNAYDLNRRGGLVLAPAVARAIDRALDP